MRHAMSTNKGTNEVPPLEDAPPEPESEEEIEKESSDEYEPVSSGSTERKRKSEKKTPKSPKSKKRKKEAEVVKPKAKANVQKKLTAEDIDEIMKRVENLPDDEPIMVMRLGALLTGYSAPRKHNLRTFLEENPVGTRIIWNEKTSTERRLPAQRPSKSLTLSSRHKEQKAKDEKKKQRPIAKITPITKPVDQGPDEPFAGTTQTNMYARKEMLKRSVSSKDPKKDKKEKPKPKKDDEGLSGRELLAAIKRGQRRGFMTGKKQGETSDTKLKSPGNQEKAPERKKPRLSHDGTETVSPRRIIDTPKKQRHPSSDPRTTTPEASEDPRRQVRRKLREVLAQRSKSSEDLRMDLQSISVLVSKIERYLHDEYKGANKEYKSKYRQIYLNLKDDKNDHFWRNVLQGEISTSMLIRMSNQEMASKEKMEWREKLEKDDIDRRKKLEEERQKEALKPTAKMTHKGEIEIDRDYNEPLDKTNDFDKTAETINKSVNNSPKKSKSEKKVKKEKKEIKKETISNAEQETIQRMLEAKAKPIKHIAPKIEAKIEHEDDDEIDEPKTPDYIPPEDNDFDDAPSPAPSPPPPDSPELAMTPPPPSSSTTHTSTSTTHSKEPKSNSLSKVWSGKITLPETTPFLANGYIISGSMDADTIKSSLPGQIRVGGKLDFDVVDNYIREVRGTSGNNRISIMSLYGKSADDESGYIESMYWLTQKNKIGVVNNFMGSLKDVYLIPLHENQALPDFLRPIDGTGLSDEHPSMFLCLLVKKSEKKKHKKPEKREEVKIEKELMYTPSVPEPAPVPVITTDMLNTIKETLNTVNPPPPSLVPSNPVGGDTYYQESGYSAASHPAPIPSSYHDYQADSRDRDSRTFRPDSQSTAQSSHYQPVHDRHWDSHHRNHRNDNRGRDRNRSGEYRRNDHSRRDRRY